jgi:hypothetical protein
MTNRSRVLILVLSCLLLPALWADDTRSVGGVKSICAKFLDKILAKDVAGAFGYLKAQPHILTDNDFVKLESQTVQKSGTIQNVFGNVIDYKLVEEKNISDVALKLVYVVRRERYLIRWNFVFYNPGRQWRLAAVSWDDKLTELF